MLEHFRIGVHAGTRRKFVNNVGLSWHSAVFFVELLFARKCTRQSSFASRFVRNGQTHENNIAESISQRIGDAETWGFYEPECQCIGAFGRTL